MSLWRPSIYFGPHRVSMIAIFVFLPLQWRALADWVRLSANDDESVNVLSLIINEL